jgi:hypothetical protein
LSQCSVTTSSKSCSKFSYLKCESLQKSMTCMWLSKV